MNRSLEWNKKSKYYQIKSWIWETAGRNQLILKRHWVSRSRFKILWRLSKNRPSGKGVSRYSVVIFTPWKSKNPFNLINKKKKEFLNNATKLSWDIVRFKTKIALMRVFRMIRGVWIYLKKLEPNLINMSLIIWWQ